MTSDLIFTLIISFVLFGFLSDRILSFLNARNWKAEVDPEMIDYYDAGKYKKAGDYEKVRSRFSLISSSFSLVAILLVLFFDGFAWLDSYLRQYTENAYLLPMLFFGLLLIASDILTLPFSIYSTFVIEEKFGFNRTTPKTYILDKIKGYALGAVLGGAVLFAFIWFFENLGDQFWLAVWLFLSGISILMMMFYTSVIVPIFNKLTPLEEGDLRKKIQDFCAQVGFKLNNLFVIDGSKRSSKSNAYFSGLGPKKKIVLFDTLIENQEEEEIVAVLAHEIGHYKHKHTFIALIASVIQTGIMLYILGLVIDNPILGQALGVEKMGLHIGLIAFSLLYSPISTFLGIGMNIMSRRHEFQADRYAATNYKSDKIVTALKKLSVDNLSNLNPHPAYVFVHYSHPPVLQRIDAIKKLTQ